MVDQGADVADPLRADLVSLGVRLKWVGAEDKEEEALAAVMEHLRYEGEGILLIYDNAIDAASLRPGADYLIARTGRTAERGAAEGLSEALGGLPLAEYSKRFAAAPGRLLDAGKDVPGEYHGGLTVAKTFCARHR